MKAAEFVLSQMVEKGIHSQINGKIKELILRQFKRDLVEMGRRRAQEALDTQLETIKEGAVNASG